MTFAEFKAAAIDDRRRRRWPTWQFVGGPNNADPGRSVTATVKLDPGTYGGRVLHPRRLRREAARRARHDRPGRGGRRRADSVDDAPNVDGARSRSSEFTFDDADASSPARASVDITNVGTQVHELVLVQAERRARRSTT